MKLAICPRVTKPSGQNWSTVQPLVIPSATSHWISCTNPEEPMSRNGPDRTTLIVTSASGAPADDRKRHSPR